MGVCGGWLDVGLLLVVLLVLRLHSSIMALRGWLRGGSGISICGLGVVRRISTLSHIE